MDKYIITAGDFFKHVFVSDDSSRPPPKKSISKDVYLNNKINKLIVMDIHQLCTQQWETTNSSQPHMKHLQI